MPTRGTAAVVDSPAIGARSLRMTPSQPSSGPGYALVQSLPVSPGRPYVLGGYLDASQLSSTEGIYFDLYDVPFDNNVRAQNGIAGWQFVYMLFTPPEGVTTVDVRIVHDGTMDPARSAFADDVALTPEPEFVPPSPCP